MKKDKFFNILACIWAGMIAILSLLPAQAAITTSLWDKLEHGLAFFTLCVLLRLGQPSRTDLVIWMTATAYGVAIELGQILSPGRFADPFDALADAVGAILGIVGVRLYRAYAGPTHSRGRSS